MASVDYSVDKSPLKSKLTENGPGPRNAVHFMKTYRIPMYGGFVTGMFPIQNWNGGIDLASAEMRVFSLQFLYSAFIFAVKIFGIMLFHSMTTHYNSAADMEIPTSNVTDFYAGRLAFFFTFCLGPFVHVLNWWRIRKYLKVLQSVDEFYTKHPLNLDDHSKEKPGPPVKGLFLTISLSVLLIGAPMYSLHHMLSSSAPDNENRGAFSASLIPGVLQTDNLGIIFTFLTICFALNETGSFFVNVTMFATSRLLALQLSNLIPLVRKKQELENGKHGVTWEAIGQQYSDYLDLFKMYQDFIGPYFTILLAISMTSTTCMIYFVLTSDYIFGNTMRAMLSMVVALTLLRIFGLVNCGEAFPKIYRKLVLEVMISYQAHPGYDKEEKTEMKRVVKLITMSKVELSASGFFVVCRRNFTSIVSVIITYIVVLLQFNNTDARNQALKNEAIASCSNQSTVFA